MTIAKVKLLRKIDAAKALGISPPMVSHLLRDGKLRERNGMVTAVSVAAYAKNRDPARVESARVANAAKGTKLPEAPGAVVGSNPAGRRMTDEGRMTMEANALSLHSLARIERNKLDELVAATVATNDAVQLIEAQARLARLAIARFAAAALAVAGDDPAAHVLDGIAKHARMAQAELAAVADEDTPAPLASAIKEPLL